MDQQFLQVSSPTINFSGKQLRAYSHIIRTIASRQASGYASKITLTNNGAIPVAFKLKTNAPQRYAVKPVFGIIQPQFFTDIYGNESLIVLYC